MPSLSTEFHEISNSLYCKKLKTYFKISGTINIFKYNNKYESSIEFDIERI